MTKHKTHPDDLAEMISKLAQEHGYAVGELALHGRLGTTLYHGIDVSTVGDAVPQYVFDAKAELDRVKVK